MEQGFERTLFASRWLMAPMYLGLALVMGLLTVVFAKELLYYLSKTLTLTADEAILAALTLIDITLAANLLLIVLFSGYENFVSRMDGVNRDQRPAWMGTVDFAGLKMKLIASIVAISGIHLLKRFMEVGHGVPMDDQHTQELFWLTVIHLVFVVSGLLMAAMDWMGAQSKGSKGGRGEPAA